MPITRISDHGRAILVRLAKRTGKTHGELIEDALALLVAKGPSDSSMLSSSAPQAKP